MNRVPVIEGLICPACGQPTRRQWQQHYHPHQPVLTLTDCVNPDCAGYYQTLTPQNFARYGLDACRHQIALVLHLYPWLSAAEAFAVYTEPPVAPLIDEAVALLDQVRVSVPVQA